MNQNHQWNIFHVNVGVHKNGEKCTSKQEWTKKIDNDVNVRNHWNYTYAKEIVNAMLEQVLVSVNI